jgi:hypothetical protein
VTPNTIVVHASPVRLTRTVINASLRRAMRHCKDYAARPPKGKRGAAAWAAMEMFVRDMETARRLLAKHNLEAR